MRSLLILLAMLAGAGAGMLQRGPVAIAGYTVAWRGGATAPPVAAPPAGDVPVVASGDYRYDAPPSISRATYIAVYCEAGSAACAEAGAMYDVLVAAGLDPAIEAGQATHETSLGTAGVGVPPIRNLHGVQCHAEDNRVGDSPVGWGNGCAGMYADYTASVATWARLITREYLPEGRNTPALVVDRYAPAGADGNTPSVYVAAMQAAIDRYRARAPQESPAGQRVAFAAPAAAGPWGNPLADPRTQLSQGYGVGSHAPAEVWGGVDLVLGDAAATRGAPVVATLDGVAQVASATWPGGNCVQIVRDTTRTTSCHLDTVAVADGTPVTRGQVLGTVGVTGMTTGPHLHYETWIDGVNVDPLATGVLP